MNENELAELDLAVAKAEGYESMLTPNGQYAIANYRQADYMQLYQPTRDPAEAMRLLEKYRLDLTPRGTDEWECWPAADIGLYYGPTPAIAICRCIVALKERTC